MNEYSNTERIEASLKRRHAKEKRFRRMGMGAIVTGLLILVFLVYTIFSNGYSAFWQTYLKLDIEFAEASIDPAGERDMEKIAGADLALSRAGGSTIAELLVLGVPPVLVPFPHSRDDHQAANAAYVAKQGAGIVCPQETFGREKVLTLIKQVLFDRDIWQARAACAYRLGRPDAARSVAALALRTVGENARGGIR